MSHIFRIAVNLCFSWIFVKSIFLLSNVFIMRNLHKVHAIFTTQPKTKIWVIWLSQFKKCNKFPCIFKDRKYQHSNRIFILHLEKALLLSPQYLNGSKNLVLTEALKSQLDVEDKFNNNSNEQKWLASAISYCRQFRNAGFLWIFPFLR